MEIRLLWDVLKQWWLLLAICIGGAFAAAVLAIALLPEIYGTGATVQLKKTSESALLLKSMPADAVGLMSFDKSYVLGTLELFMQNDALIQRVIDQCGLTEEVSYSPAKFSSPGRVSIAWRQRGVSIQAEKDSEIFIIKGISPDREEAARIANTFVEEFFRFYQDMRRDQFLRSQHSFTLKQEELRVWLDEIELEEQQFRKAHDLLSVDTQRGYLLAQKKALDDEWYDLQAKLSAELTEKTDAHPDILRFRQTMRENRARLNEIRTQIHTFLEMETDYKRLQRKRSNLDKLFDEVDAALKVLYAVERLDLSHFFLVNEAAVPSEGSDYREMPKTVPMMALFLALGVFGGLFLVFVVDYSIDSPRLFSSFRGFFHESPCYVIAGRRGWSRLAAALHPYQKVRVLHKSGTRPAVRFCARLQKHLEKLDRAPSLQPLEDSRTQPETYLSTGPVDDTVTLYVVRAGRTPRSDIEADLQFFRKRHTTNKLIGVFHHG